MPDSSGEVRCTLCTVPDGGIPDFRSSEAVLKDVSRQTTVFLTISTTGTPERPATDLGFLLHKHPDKAQAFSTSYGKAHVVYPEASVERCTAALLLEVDAVALVRRGKGKGRGGAPDAALAQYVNDRPYAASSLLAVALSSVFSSAMKGTCQAKPDLPARPLPLRVEVPALPARGGADLVRALFEPLGWTVSAEPVALDTEFPEWGDSRYVSLVLEGEQRLADALRHLYVLLPVLDDAKHYWVSSDEVDKLLRAGEGWLPDAPGAEADHQPLSVPPLVADPAGHGAPRTRTARRDRRQRGRGDRQRRRRADGHRGEAGTARRAAARRDRRRAEGHRRRAGPRSGLRAGPVGAGAAQGHAVHRDRRGRRLDAGAHHRLAAAQAGADGRAAVRARQARPGFARLHRQAAQGVRRRRAERGHRAPRPAAAARPGVRGVRFGAPAGP